MKTEQRSAILVTPEQQPAATRTNARTMDDLQNISTDELNELAEKAVLELSAVLRGHHPAVIMAALAECTAKVIVGHRNPIDGSQTKEMHAALTEAQEALVKKFIEALRQ